MTASRIVKKILIVDDTEVIRNLLSELLVSEGFEVVCAKDGVEAISIIESQDIDLVFCDIHMPRKNGLDTLRTSRTLKPGLLFIMTDSLPDEMAETAQKYGAISCISKPFDLEEIRESVLRAESIYSKGTHAERTL